MNNPKYFRGTEQEEAEEYFYKEVAKRPKYIGLFYDYVNFYFEIHLHIPPSYVKWLKVIKIHGRI